MQPISPYVVKLLREDKLVYSGEGSTTFAMSDGKFCIVGWAYDRTNDYGIIGNPKYCERCDNLSMEMYDNHDGRQASKRLLKSILKFTEHFKSTHK